MNLEQQGRPSSASLSKKKVWIFMSVLILIIISAGVGIGFMIKDRFIKESTSQKDSFSPMTIDRIENSAFGEIAFSSEANSERASASPLGLGSNLAMNEMAVKQTSSIAVPVPSVAVEDGAVATDSAVVSDKMIAIMPPYDQTIVEYMYKGEALTLSDEMLDVYKKTSGSFSAKQLASAVNGMNFGIMNLSSFDGMQVGDLSLYQDKPYGYQLYISPRNGMISIDQNWDTWRDAYPACMDGNCTNTQLNASDIPSDDELIRITDAFLTDHGIDRSAYGKGKVNRNWEMYAYGKEESAYVPDAVTVNYPLLVDGQTVYQNGEMNVGMNVTVNIRVKKVSNLYGLEAVSLKASSYEAITDTEEILSSAKEGGLSSSIRYMDEATLAQAKKIEAELGTPTRGLMQIYQYKDNQSIELYVPALFFPVTKKPDEQYWALDTVIVPLVKGIESDYPQIMPMMRTESGVSGSSGGMATPAIEPAIDIAPVTQEATKR
jgi:hypothetical protein